MYVEVIARSAPQGETRQSAQQLPQIYISQQLPQIYIRQDLERRYTVYAEVLQISLYLYLNILTRSTLLKVSNHQNMKWKRTNWFSQTSKPSFEIQRQIVFFSREEWQGYYKYMNNII